MISPRCVSSTDMIVDRREPSRFSDCGEHLRHPERLHAESRLPRLLAGHAGPRAVADDDHHVADAQLAAGDDGAVDLDLIGLGGDAEIVAEA